MPDQNGVVDLSELGLAEPPPAPATADAKPKRHRRTKEEMEAARAAGDAAPKTSTRRSSKARNAEAITALVSAFNLPLSIFAPQDVLTEKEQALLSDALTAEAESSARVQKFLNSSSPIMSHIALIAAATIIAIPRLQRRGILPVRELTPEQEAQLREFAAANRQTFPSQTDGSTIIDATADTPIYMEAR